MRAKEEMDLIEGSKTDTEESSAVLISQTKHKVLTTRCLHALHIQTIELQKERAKNKEKLYSYMC